MTTFECIRPYVEEAERERKRLQRQHRQRQINALTIIGTWVAIIGYATFLAWEVARAIDKGF